MLSARSRLSGLAIAAVAFLLARVASAADSATTTPSPATQGGIAVETIAQPCRATQILGTRLIKDRRDGRDRLVLVNNNEKTGLELLFLDIEKNSWQTFKAPGGSGGWDCLEIPGDRLVVGTFYDGKFLVFDLRAMKFLAPIAFPKENYIWNLALGRDGRVYGGTYPGGKLGALDPATYAFEDLGAPVPPNQYLRYVSHAPWGQLFCNFGMADSTTRIYDIPSKSWKEISGLPKGASFGVGVEWDGCFVTSDPRSGRLEAFTDASLKPADPRRFPWEEGLQLYKALCTAKTLYFQRGNALLCFNAGDTKLTPVIDLELDGGRYVGLTSDGDLVGLRGQAWFKLNPASPTLDLHPITADIAPRPIMFLRADPSGSLWGGPHFGQTLFWYDPRTGKAFNTDVVSNSGGEVYDAAFDEEHVYAAAYAGGDIVAYKPAAPWDQRGNRNPRLLTSLGSRGYIRPIGGIQLADDGKLYAGWMAKYGTYGGAISITDRQTGETDLIENPLGSQAIRSLAVAAGRAYMGTNLEANGLPAQAGKAKFGVVDLATRKVLLEKELEGGTVAEVTVISGGRYVAARNHQTLLLLDTKTLELLPVPTTLPKLSGAILPVRGAPAILAAAGRSILRIDLPACTARTVVEMPTSFQRMTQAPDGRLYFADGVNLMRTKEPMPQ